MDGVIVEVFVVVIVLVPDDEPLEDFVDVNEAVVVLVKIFDDVPFKEVVIDAELEDVFELLIERVFVVELLEVLDGLVVIVDEGELDVVFDSVDDLDDDLVFKDVIEGFDDDVNVEVNLDVNDGKFEAEDVLLTVDVLVEVFDAV